MRILFLSPRLPHDRAIGGLAIVYRRIRKLSERGHRIHLACFLHEEDEPHLESVQSCVEEIETLPPPPPPVSRTGRIVRSLFGGIPPPFTDWFAPAMQRRAGNIVERSNCDVALSEFSEMGPYLYKNPFLPAVRRIISCHKCATIVTRRKLSVKGYALATWRERLGFEALQRYEFDMYRNVDHMLVLTDQERNELLSYSLNVPLSVVPSGVDINFYRAEQREPADPPSLLFTGNYSDPPNREAVTWFVKKVWPGLRAAFSDLRFYVVGPEPSPEMIEFGRRDDHIVITGRLEDIRPYLARASIFVCPIRTGSGLQGKVLEAMSCKVPVVSTSAGVEGLPAQNGDNCLIADHENIMRENIALLLRDSALSDRLADNAYALAGRYSWDRSIQLLEDVLENVVQ